MVADKPRRMRGKGDRRQDRETFEITLIRGARGFFCLGDLSVIKPNGRRNSPAISHRFQLAKEGRFDPRVDRLGIEAKRYIVISGQVGPR